MEVPGIDPGTSRMLSERSTIWATPHDSVTLEIHLSRIMVVVSMGESGQVLEQLSIIPQLKRLITCVAQITVIKLGVLLATSSPQANF